MELEEFERLNPIICGKYNKSYSRWSAKSETRRIQGEYLKTRTFILDSLSGNQALILRLRYGIDDGKFLSLSQVGDMLGITHERVRQIEEVAFEKLRHPIRIKWLMEYTDETFDKALFEELINFKSLIRKDIIANINEKTLQIVENIRIDDLEIKSKHTVNIKMKLNQGGINTCADLIRYLQTHSNLRLLGIGDISYNKVIATIYELIENGTIKITSQENLNDYLLHGGKVYGTQPIDLQDEIQQETRLKNWSENLDRIYIRDFKFSNRTTNCLVRAGIHTLQDLVDYYTLYGNFSGITNLGVKCEQEIYDKMKKIGLNLYELLLQNRKNILNNAMQNPENVLIENLEFSDRTYNSLKRAGINNLRDLINYYSTYRTLCRIQNLGTKTQTEILNKLISLGIDLDKFLAESSNNSDLKA